MPQKLGKKVQKSLEKTQNEEKNIINEKGHKKKPNNIR